MQKVCKWVCAHAHMYRHLFTQTLRLQACTDVHALTHAWTQNATTCAPRTCPTHNATPNTCMCTVRTCCAQVVQCRYAQGSFQATTCTACRPGFFSYEEKPLGRLFECTNCRTGLFTEANASTACEDCPARTSNLQMLQYVEGDLSTFELKSKKDCICEVTVPQQFHSDALYLCFYFVRFHISGRFLEARWSARC